MSTTTKKKELTIGIAMIGASLAYLVMAYQLPGHDGVDAGTVPILLAGLMLLLGAMQLLTALAQKPQARTEAASQGSSDLPELPTEAAPKEIIEPKTVLLTLGLMLGYIALLGPVGFPVMTVIYLYLQFLVLTPVRQKPRHLSYLLISVISSAAIFLLFREAFDLMLPAGLLNNFL
ncbi:tripartite tricarboxylate transporter TctB family protein [Pseudomonas daroniae]|uniref:Tripartite tricarboxylate transporter TctB family protein n=1 Tax=Phytopseudomonas daroniae TaxID=2487519 RepID=A0A4V2KAY8_9GAMM|nr:MULTISPECIES: tripartite tricarboxylate transporter TctB family protein [Pseudomonas]TBU75587.1 tripartite tricarboxylate transporter TctB family protein [Pseudomonas daroniae]TBU81466.1 tripartite tricarboxylate transporter TctB family protein [Pseudomonas daroniae]TBU84370.1 tripartite tricarboxylate transporter TctB family protein [Pseudomonas sp. FRB 228]TBU89837.1 tripartite tricarboxylate transporter TctB family protein [Pseudomonas daroniae]